MVGKLEGLSEEELLKIIQNRPELKEQIMPSVDDRSSVKPLPKISDKKPRRKKSAKVVTRKEIEESFGEQAKKQIAEQLGKVEKSEQVKPNDEAITVDADTKKPKRVNSKKLVKEQLKNKKVPRALDRSDRAVDRDSEINPISSYLIRSFERTNPMLSSIIDFIFKDKNKPTQPKQEHMQASTSATAVRQSGILNDNLNIIKENQQNTIDILTRIEKSISEAMKRSREGDSGGILNTVLDALSSARGLGLLRNVLRAAPLVAAAAAVGAGLWRARNTEEGRSDFEESERSLEETARDQRRMAEPVGDLPSPSSMIDASEDEVKSTLMSYGLSERDTKFKEWMEEWKKLISQPRPASSLNPASANDMVPVGPVVSDSYSRPQQGVSRTSASLISSEQNQNENTNVIEFKANEIVFKANSIDFSQKNAPSAGVASFQRASFAPGAMISPAAQMQATPVTPSTTPSPGPGPGPDSPPGSEMANQNLSGGQLSLPVNAKVTSPYGQRASGMHPGIDFGVPEGTPIRSSQAGVVTRIDNEAKGYGNWVEVTDKTTGISTRYAHLSKPTVSNGQQVNAGDVVGLSGNTGRSTGPHLHFEVLKDGKKVDPTSYISGGVKEVPENQQKDNENVSGAAAASPGPEIVDPNLEPPPGASSTGEGAAPATMIEGGKAGGMVSEASKNNEFSKMEDSMPKTPEVMNMNQSESDFRAPGSTNSIDPNEPGNVEPEDSILRYSKLFGLAA